MELDRVMRIISEILGTGTGSLTEETRLVEDLGANSLDMFQIAMAVEEEYDIEIEEDVLERIRTVGDAADFVREKTGYQEE